MLESLHVKNLALIDEIEVDFHHGLNILTGETGAGKSIILGSVNLALGGRYTADMLRTGASYGLVELVFTIENPAIEQTLNGWDIYPEDGRIMLSRRLMEGRSVSRINGETVSMGTLKDVASLLIDIHGQNDHQTLLHKKNHLVFLDQYAKDAIEDLKEETAQNYKEYASCKKELEESNLDERERQKEISLAEFETQEIEEAGLVEGEDEELEGKYRRMSDSRKVTERISEAHDYTEGNTSESASDSLSRAIHALQEVQDYDEEGSALYGQLVEIDDLLNDFNRELSDYAKSFEYSEEEFYETENRLNEINRLKSKYGNTVSEILDYYEGQKKRLDELNDYQAYREHLQENLTKAENDYLENAGKLSEIRKKEAKDFEELIRQNLEDLNFLDVQFEIRFTKTDHYTADGMDDVEFYISTNPGEELRPLGTTASGGELSRIMLAIKTVLADKEDTPTLIFDEIDTGIGGATAGKVAQKMQLIGKSRQVLCITHLAQIAAKADAHYLIHKASDKNVTRTEISFLEREESIEELARLLGGENITSHIMESAREMKDSAKEES